MSQTPTKDRQVDWLETAMMCCACADGLSCRHGQPILALLTNNGWQPIETAPKDIIERRDFHSYGEHVLLFPYWGEVVRGRWWQGSDPNYCNWLVDGGAAFRPTHWHPSPRPPVDTKAVK